MPDHWNFLFLGKGVVTSSDCSPSRGTEPLSELRRSKDPRRWVPRNSPAPAESPPRVRARHPALSWNSEANLPLGLETAVRPRLPLHTISRSLICRDVYPSRVRRQVLRVLIALGLLASSSKGFPGLPCRGIWRRPHGRTEVEVRGRGGGRSGEN